MTRTKSPPVRGLRLGAEHLEATSSALDDFVGELPHLERWGRRLAVLLVAGGRLLVAGNGGSAALAEHLTSELVGRYRDERVPLSAIGLHADGAAVTAIVNDYGPDEVFARQVQAHGRVGDVLLALSTSGRSSNILAAVQAARARSMRTWALTGSARTLLHETCEESVTVNSSTTAIVQEVHQVAVHILCEVIDEEVHELEILR